MYKAIVFDLDGTLMDTLEDLKNSINETLKIYGYEEKYSYEETKRLIGSGIRNLCKRAIANENPSEEEIDKIWKKFIEIYDRRQLENTKPFLGINDMILALKQMDIKCCVLSNKADDNTNRIINTYFENGTFDYIFGKKENFPLKPDPYSLNLLIEKLSLKNNEILYVGDSDVDMQTGINANVDFCAVSWGYRDIELLKNYKPTYILEKPMDLIQIIKNNK